MTVTDHPSHSSELRHVLCVDDALVDLKLLERSLRATGAALDVHLCTKPQAALEHVQTHEVDLAILDVQMPGMCGIELLETLKERMPDRLPKVVIFLSTLEDPDIQRAAYALGATAYMLKPAGVYEYGILCESILDLWRRLHTA